MSAQFKCWGSRKLSEQDCISYNLEVYQRVMELHRKQKIHYMWLLTLYGTWISWVAQLIIKCQHQKWDTLPCEFWSVLLLPSVMWMLQSRKVYFPYKEMLSMKCICFFKTWLGIHLSFFHFCLHLGIATYILAFFIIWGNNSFHMVREWNHLVGLLWHMWQIVPSPSVTEWVILE